MAKNPIGKTERERLGGLFRNLQDAVGLIQAAKKCGVNCAQREQLLHQIYEVASNIQTEFVGLAPTPLSSPSNGQPFHVANPASST